MQREICINDAKISICINFNFGLLLIFIHKIERSINLVLICARPRFTHSRCTRTVHEHTTHAYNRALTFDWKSDASSERAAAAAPRVCVCMRIACSRESTRAPAIYSRIYHKTVTHTLLLSTLRTLRGEFQFMSRVDQAARAPLTAVPAYTIYMHIKYDSKFMR